MEQKKVLVIDDNDLNLKLVRSILHLGGYRVLEASNAKAGIDLVLTQKPDLVLMDIQLPGIDGFQATRIIRDHLCPKKLPIIALSGYATQGDEIKAKEAGCDGYITKPLDTRSFLKTIGEFIASEP